LTAAPSVSQTLGASIKIEISRIRNQEGDVGCALFNSPIGFAESDAHAHTARYVPIVSGSALCEFQGLAPGTYAAIVFHDENSNGRLDKNLFGIPLEGYGASNNVRSAISAPKFSTASFFFPRMRMCILLYK
jgi:uncharacterized protein (DUF2141 family)